MKQQLKTRWSLDMKMVEEVVLTNHNTNLEDLKLKIINANSNEELLQIIENCFNDFKVLSFTEICEDKNQSYLDYSVRKMVYFYNHIILNHYNLDFYDFHNENTTITENEFLNNFMSLYVDKIVGEKKLKDDVYLEFKKTLKYSSTEFYETSHKKGQLSLILNLINKLLCEFVYEDKNKQFANIAYKKLNQTQFKELMAMYFNYHQYKFKKEDITKSKKVALLIWEQLKKCFVNKQILKLLDELFIIWKVPTTEPEVIIPQFINLLDHLKNQLVVWLVKREIEPQTFSSLVELREEDIG